ncbi:hypothetical protein DM828_17410 [Pseudomonas umsongensis]|nr:hypothetical protein [Pseudomonas umsongensis]
MVVNDDAGSLTPRGVLRFIASMLAPTRVRVWHRLLCWIDRVASTLSASQERARHVPVAVPEPVTRPQCLSSPPPWP